MPRDERMFGDVVDPSITMGSHQGRSVALTIVLETVLVVAVIAIPVLATDVLPAAPDMIGAFVVAAPPPTPPPPPPRGGSSRSPSPPVEPVNIDVAPVEAPDTFTPESAPVDTGFERGGSPNIGDGILRGTGGVDGGVDVGPPPPAPAVLPPAPKPPPRVGGIIQVPRKTRDVKPVYPPLALRAGVQGVVILEATIDTAGRVTDLRVVQSKPLLDQAAIDAVRQWEFTPSLLGGEPTAVIMNVTVNFQLN